VAIFTSKLQPTRGFHIIEIYWNRKLLVTINSMKNHTKQITLLLQYSSMFQQWPSLCKKNFVSSHPAALFSLYGLHQRCTNSRHQVTQATTFWTVAPNICRFSVGNLLHITLPAPTILRWLLVFWRICAPLAYTQCTQFIPHFDMMPII
jgi:hypothetical protein